MELSPVPFPDPTSFRFFADFFVQVRPDAFATLTIEQRILLHTVAASPAALRRITRMAVEMDLEAITGSHLSDLFEGPTNKELLACIWSCLPEGEATYWHGLKAQSEEALVAEVITVFMAFEVTLRRAAIDDFPPTGEPIRKAVGQTLDARTVRK